MSIFETAINDIFKIQDFLDTFSVNGVNIPCIVSPITEEISYSEIGLVNEANFTLDIEYSYVDQVPVESKITFKGKSYRVNSVVTDSSFTSAKLHLEDLSRG